MEEIYRGAEAVIYKDKGSIVKKRTAKGYRLKKLDEQIRKQRTKREAKVLEKLDKLKINSPKLISADNETITMEYVPGTRLADFLNKKNYKLMEKVGVLIGKLHDADISHGDLTTSNIIYNKEIYLIDFGLSFFSHKIEDKAVDVHLLKEALEAKHYDIYELGFNSFKKGYKKSRNYKEVMERLEKVESRGRYKGKGGFE